MDKYTLEISKNDDFGIDSAFSAPSKITSELFFGYIGEKGERRETLVNLSHSHFQYFNNGL